MRGSRNLSGKCKLERKKNEIENLGVCLPSSQVYLSQALIEPAGQQHDAQMGENPELYGNSQGWSLCSQVNAIFPSNGKLLAIKSETLGGVVLFPARIP